MLLVISKTLPVMYAYSFVQARRSTLLVTCDVDKETLQLADVFDIRMITR